MRPGPRSNHVAPGRQLAPGRHLAPLLVTVPVLTAAFLLWAMWLARCAWILAAHAGQVPRRNTWLYDWNVYHAAAIDLLDRTLYRVPLLEPGHELPIEFFNYPPLAAAWAVPLLPFGREPGGVAWLVIGVVATSVGALLGARALNLPWIGAILVAGVGLAVYTGWGHIDSHVLLGNNNHLMFALVGCFALAHRRGNQRLAGVLLALAIGTKLWPVALVVLLLRERRRQELRWTAGVLAVQATILLAWLGLDAIGPMVPAIVGQNVSRGIPPTELLIWTSWARAAWDWWPAWGGYAMAAGLLLVPATGRLGLGLGIVGGLSLNNYVWHHYAPVLVFGACLVIVGAVALVRRRRSAERGAPQQMGAEPAD